MAASVSETSASYDWTNRTHVVIKPQAELAPNTTYELFDHHPSLPCYPDSGAQCEAATVTTFATFTTGSLPDTTPPQFDGLESVLPQASHEVCENSACCGPYIIHRLFLQWKLGGDDRTGEEVAYNVYRDGQLFISLLRGPSLNGVQFCSGGGPFGPLLPAGDYTVRAVDWAGNEDGNGRVHTVPSLCSVIASPSDGGTDASSGFDVMPTNDGSGAQHGGGDGAPADGAAAALPASDGCGCRVGRARSNLCGLALVVMAILVTVLRRRPALQCHNSSDTDLVIRSASHAKSKATADNDVPNSDIDVGSLVAMCDGPECLQRRRVQNAKRRCSER